MSAATKVAAFALALRVLQTAFPQELYLWSWAFAGIAVASLAIGNFAALVQRNVKRMLAYSSISHAGFLLIGLSAGGALGGRALMYYLIVYAAMAFGSFAVVAARERELGEAVTLDNLAGFGWERPFLGLSMWLFMFGFAGLPVGGGFVAKFYVLSAAYRHGWTWLVIVGVIATLVSLYYYLAVVRAMYMRPSAELRVAPVAGGSPAPEPLLHVAVGLALTVSVGSIFAVGPLGLRREHLRSLRPGKPGNRPLLPGVWGAVRRFGLGSARGAPGRQRDLRRPRRLHRPSRAARSRGRPSDPHPLPRMRSQGDRVLQRRRREVHRRCRHGSVRRADRLR
jgi:formate hydrogenlyase subunit 3/multisubunit Na+/H+ antiporter MnhD subunit